MMIWWNFRQRPNPNLIPQGTSGASIRLQLCAISKQKSQFLICSHQSVIAFGRLKHPCILFFYFLFLFILFIFLNPPSAHSLLKVFVYWFEQGRETSICCPTYLCIHWLILVCAPPGIELTTLAYRDDALTSWTTWPGPPMHFQFSAFVDKGLK